MEKTGIRINQFLARSGICSRREADALVANEEIKINDKLATMGDRVTDEDVVFYKGKAINTAKQAKDVYIVLNKPRGIVCTTDTREEDNIVDYMNFSTRIFPIGRLDKASSGLILLTNDGTIVNRILRSRYGHEKEYRVKVDRPITDEFIKQMSTGVPILNTVTKPAVVKKINKQVFHITITQGLNRQIRRMCEYCGYRVTKLKRLRIMNIELSDLPEGQWRYLSNREKRELDVLLRAGERDYAMKNKKWKKISQE